MLRPKDESVVEREWREGRTTFESMMENNEGGVRKLVDKKRKMVSE